MIQSAQAAQQIVPLAGVAGAIEAQSGGVPIRGQGPTIALLKAFLEHTDTLSQVIGGEKQQAMLTGRKDTLDAQKEANDRLAEASKALGEELKRFQGEMTGKELGPVAKIYQQRDELVQKGVIWGVATDYANIGASRELDKEEAEDQKRQQKMLLDYLEGTQKSRQEEAKGLDAWDKSTIAAFQAKIANAQAWGQFYATSDITRLGVESSHAEHMATIAAGPGAGGQAALAQQELGIKQQEIAAELKIKEIHSDLYDMDQERFKAEMDNLKARDEYEEKIAEIQKQQYREIANSSTALYHTLFTHPQAFPKQLTSTLREAAIKPVTQWMGQATVSFLSPMFGVGSDPVKISTDMNTQATVQNTMALQQVANSITAGSTRTAAAVTSSTGGGTSLPTAAARGGWAAPDVFNLPFISQPNPAAVLPALMMGGGSRVPAVGGGGGSWGTSIFNLPMVNQPSPTSLLPSLSVTGGTQLPPSMGGGSTTDIFNLPMVNQPNPADLLPALMGAGAGTGAGNFGGVGGFRSSGATSLGPGGTSGFTGAVRGIEGMLGMGGGGGGTAGGAGGGGGFGGMFSAGNLSKMASNLGKSVGYAGGGVWNMPGGGWVLNPSFGQAAESVASSPASGMIGSMLATSGLLGANRGTLAGTLEGAAGGAMIGMATAGPIGAAVGASAGLLTGAIETALGIESPENKAKQMVKQLYGISINDATAKQIVAIAQQKYAGQVDVAVRDPDVRKMLMLYSEATGQKMPLSSTTPQAASLVEQNGKLFQAPTYSVNGTPYTFPSSLPVLGGYNTGTYPGPSSVVLNVNGQSAADLLEGRIANTVTPNYVQSAWSNAGYSSDGRLNNSAMIQQPGLIIS